MDDNQKYELEAIYQRNTLEWFALRQKFDQDVKYKQGRELFEWKRQELRELLELLENHKRDLDSRVGEHTPKVQFAEADFKGLLGGGAI